MIEILNANIDLHSEEINVDAVSLSEDVIRITFQEKPCYGQVVKITMTKEQATKLAEAILEQL